MNVRLGQFSDYLSKNSRIFVLTLGKFDDGVTETGRELNVTVCRRYGFFSGFSQGWQSMYSTVAYMINIFLSLVVEGHH